MGAGWSRWWLDGTHKQRALYMVASQQRAFEREGGFSGFVPQAERSGFEGFAGYLPTSERDPINAASYALWQSTPCDCPFCVLLRV